MAQDGAGRQLIAELATDLTDRKKRDAAIDTIIQSSVDGRRGWLEAMLQGSLYVRKYDGRPVIVEKQGKRFSLIDAVTDEALGQVGKREVRKVKINNALRSRLRSAIARLALQDADPQARRAAVERMLQSLDKHSVVAIQQQLTLETDSSVQSVLKLALILNDLEHADEARQLQAIEQLGTDTRDVTVQRIRVLAQAQDKPAVSAAASNRLQEIEQRIRLFGYLETLLFGLSLGSVLAMAAIGLAITFGVMGVINMAHGEMIMLGAYTTWAIQQVLPGLLEASLLLALPLAFAVAFGTGLLIEFLVIRHLYGRPLETLLATFGISLILQQTVRTLISPQNVPVVNPAWLSGQWQLDPALSVSINRVAIFVFCLLVFCALMWLLRRTFFGLKVRATSQNRDMARVMGARSSRIDAMTFGLGAGIAGVAGVALSQLTNVGPNMGQSYIVDSFMVVVFGGVGNLWGTLLAGLSLGVVNKFLEPWAGAVLAKIIVLIFIILFIQKYPRGLFPQRGRAAGE